MSSRSIRQGVALCWIVVLAQVTGSGCIANDRKELGRRQVGDAGGFCSFLTTILVGPNVGRGRNEGHLKTTGEIVSLFGPFGVRRRIEDWRLAATGIGLEEYQGMTFAPSLLSLREDTFLTALEVKGRCLVPEEDLKAFYSYLFSGHFLSVDVLLAALEQGSVDIQGVRRQFWLWVGYTYDHYQHDFYLFPGNKNMMQRLYERGVVSKEEAVYLLSRWFVERKAYVASMLDDMEGFRILRSEEVDRLAELELAHLPGVEVSNGRIKGLLSEQMGLLRKVRGQVRWPITIPGYSRIKARSMPSRNRFRSSKLSYQSGQLTPIPIPFTFKRYVGYDPRIAVSLNDGRRLSRSERLSRWGFGNVLSSYGAARGKTQTGFEFERRLLSPASRLSIEMIELGIRRGLVSREWFADYLGRLVRAGYCSQYVFQLCKQYAEPVVPVILNNAVFFRRCFFAGVSVEDIDWFRNFDDGRYLARIEALLESKLMSRPTSISSKSLVSAEGLDLSSSARTDALLVARFYHLLEQLAFAASIPAKVDFGWRKRAQRIEVDRAMYELRAKQALEAVQAMDP